MSFDPIAELLSYLERKLQYAEEDVKLGIMPGVQDSIELQRLQGRIEELKSMRAFIKFHLLEQSGS